MSKACLEIRNGLKSLLIVVILSSISAGAFASWRSTPNSNIWNITATAGGFIVLPADLGSIANDCPSGLQIIETTVDGIQISQSDVNRYFSLVLAAKSMKKPLQFLVGSTSCKVYQVVVVDNW